MNATKKLYQAPVVRPVGKAVERTEANVSGIAETSSPFLRQNVVGGVGFGL